MFPCLLLSLTDVCVHVCIALSGPLVSCCQQIFHSGNTALVWLREEHEASVCVCVCGRVKRTKRRSVFSSIETEESFPGCGCTSDVRGA